MIEKLGGDIMGNLKHNALLENAVPFSSQNKWVKRLSPLLLVALLIGLFFASILITIPFAIMSVILEVIGILDNLDPLLNETLIFTMHLIIAFVGIHIIIFLWVRFREKRSFKSIGLQGKKKGIKFGVGFGLATLSMTITALLTVLLGEGTINADPTRVVGLAALPYIMIVLIGWFVQASAEEVLFQGWFMPKATKMYGPIIGVAMSAFIFALFHAFNPGMTILPFINLTLYGVFAALYAIYEEGIMGVVGYHIAWNWAQGNLFGLEVSGQESISATLMNVNVQSPNIFTGTNFGPEGGLIITIVLAVSIFIVGTLLRKKIA